jgi:hypothetical protein
MQIETEGLIFVGYLSPIDKSICTQILYKKQKSTWKYFSKCLIICDPVRIQFESFYDGFATPESLSIEEYSLNYPKSCYAADQCG